MLNLVAEVEQLTLTEALTRWDVPQWEEASQLELNMLRNMKCWDVVDLPKGCKAIRSLFVYKLNLGKDNQPVSYKACLVAKGFQQRWGVDYVD